MPNRQLPVLDNDVCEAAPFIELTTVCFNVKEFHRVEQPKDPPHG